jgi:hypothetical protein
MLGLSPAARPSSNRRLPVRRTATIGLALVLTACGAPDAASPACGGRDTTAASLDAGWSPERDAAPGHSLDRGSGSSHEPAFGAIYREIIVAKACVLGVCHGEGGNAAGLNLWPLQAAYANLVAVPSGSRNCSELGLLQVEPGNAERSLFYLKLQSNPPCGVPMPPNALVEPEQLAQVKRWIEAGAAHD